MGRRKKNRGFEWVAEDAEGEAIEKVERPNRSALKRARKRLEGLAKDLGKLSPGHRAQLSLDDATKEAIEAYADSGNAPDRRRKLLYLTTLLVNAEVDADELEAELARMG